MNPKQMYSMGDSTSGGATSEHQPMPPVCTSSSSEKNALSSRITHPPSDGDV
ncbi:MAG: hypothetical protein HXS43_09915 [Theionarchaea archaeon]|nr:hypothetical protein [Theionarchaea archaeon]